MNYKYMSTIQNIQLDVIQNLYMKTNKQLQVREIVQILNTFSSICTLDQLSPFKTRCPRGLMDRIIPLGSLSFRRNLWMYEVEDTG